MTGTTAEINGDVNRALAAYLHDEAGAPRIMLGIRKKYESLNAVGGRYVLVNPTEEERLFLRGLFKKDYSENRRITISLEKFELAFQRTRFRGCELPRVLEAYFQGPIETKRSRSEREQEEKTRFFDRLIDTVDRRDLATWIEKALSDPSSGSARWLNGLYHEDPVKLESVIGHLRVLLEILESDAGLWSRPVLAATVTRDPHALDDGTPLHRALLYLASEGAGRLFPKNAEERTACLAEWGIVVDGLHMTVPAYGVLATGPDGVSLAWETFYRRKEPLILTSYHLKSVSRLSTIGGGPVFAFENPAVFDAFLRRLPKAAAICTSGQVHQSAYALLDKLEESRVPVIYSGDYDPEGLLIAQRLLDRYTNLTLGLYDPELYLKIRSNKTLSARRIHSLEGLHDPRLLAVAACLRIHRQPGYQEYMMEDILADVQRTLSP